MSASSGRSSPSAASSRSRSTRWASTPRSRGSSAGPRPDPRRGEGAHFRRGATLGHVGRSLTPRTPRRMMSAPLIAMACGLRLRRVHLPAAPRRQPGAPVGGGRRPVAPSGLHADVAAGLDTRARGLRPARAGPAPRCARAGAAPHAVRGRPRRPGARRARAAYLPTARSSSRSRRPSWASPASWPRPSSPRDRRSPPRAGPWSPAASSCWSS